jgi:hypothetical protein
MIPLGMTSPVHCEYTEEVDRPKVIVTAAAIESRMFGDFIFGLLEVENPEKPDCIQDNPKQRKVKENLGFPWLRRFYARQTWH